MLKQRRYICYNCIKGYMKRCKKEDKNGKKAFKCNLCGFTFFEEDIPYAKDVLPKRIYNNCLSPRGI